LEQARPIQQWARTWPAVFSTYLAALRAARPADAARTFIRILQLGVQHGEAALATALERAMALDCWSAEGVEQLLRQAQEPTVPSVPVDLAAAPSLAPLAAVQIPLPDLAAFTPLVEGGWR
jgi:hypothetical protein